MKEETNWMQGLFDYMANEHDCMLLESDMFQIQDIVLESYKKELVEKIRDVLEPLSPGMDDMAKARRFEQQLIIKIIEG